MNDYNFEIRLRKIQEDIRTLFKFNQQDMIQIDKLKREIVDLKERLKKEIN